MSGKVRETAAAYAVLIRDIPAEERPRERLRVRGPGRLSNAELLAILLRTGSAGESVVNLAARLLGRVGGLGGLGRASFAELCSERSIGQAKAAQVLAALELGKRIVSAQPEQGAVIRSPEDVNALLLGEMALLEQEHLRVVLLNSRNQLQSVQEVYKGNVSGAIVRMAEVFKDAVRDGCSSLVIVHNHPSGDPKPSPEDVSLTKQAVEAGKLLGIDVLDHVIIARGGYVSLKEGRLGFE